MNADHSLRRINELLGQIATSALQPGEPWTGAALRDIKALAPGAFEKWNRLLVHLQTATGSKPSKKWLDGAASLIEAFGKKAFHYFLSSWLPIAATQTRMFTRKSETILKGLVWAASIEPEAEIIGKIGDLGEACWKKIPYHGPCSKVVGNAVFWSLSAIGTDHAVAQLTRVNARLKHGSARKLADKAINRVAESSGQTRADLEETTVPTFGLSPDCKVSQVVGSYTAVLAITPTFDATLNFVDSRGKQRKSIPAEIKTEHSRELRALQKTLKQLQALLPGQKARIESILRHPDRSWSYADWRKRYLDHPIMWQLARRLIWRFDASVGSHTAMPIDLQLIDAAGDCVTGAPETRVRLWHPCSDSVESVRAWRAFLDNRRITQPFKQAHREVYLLTEAERTTYTYSNRFAAHIIRQHQFNALCAHRGWKYRLQGNWDGANTPTLELPALGFASEFWVNQVAEGFDENTSGAGVSLHLSTDQVRFYRDHQIVPLHEVPAQLFSEIMRDIDLFVGVASVGNDPAWQDGGPQGRYRAYWQNYSFGELNETAKTRRAVLETLIPRLKIAALCSLTDKFLRVQGSLRAYKIHLGSGNILMEPNDQYLCIVPSQSGRAPGDIFLPFEGDATLAIILSKAFLLAGDANITDETITRQIRSA